MPYKMDMSEEKKPSTKVLLPEGWRKFRIIGCEEGTSKAGNLMFVITAEDDETGYEDTWYAVAEPKKRWFLKSVLAACGCSAAQDGVYNWDISDIVGKNVEGFITHEDNTWINREGETIVTKQHRVSDIKEAEQPTTIKAEPIPEEEVAWDDDK